MGTAQPKAIALHGRPAGSGRFPAICAPLVGRTREKLVSEAAVLAAHNPDIIEWRVDFFDSIADTAAVIEAGERIRQAAPGIPLLFTRRSMREGGERIALAEQQVVALYRAVCAAGQADIVDYEMGNEAGAVREMRELSRSHGVQLVLSFHDFQATPPLDVLNERFARAQALGADIAKVAVMPRAMDDVLTLLQATLQASRTLEIPVVSMAMGGLGTLTRVCGWAFGSAMTFAVGDGISAPGQMPIEEVEAALAVLRRGMGKP